MQTIHIIEFVFCFFSNSQVPSKNLSSPFYFACPTGSVQTLFEKKKIYFELFFPIHWIWIGNWVDSVCVCVFYGSSTKINSSFLLFRFFYIVIDIEMFIDRNHYSLRDLKLICKKKKNLYNKNYIIFEPYSFICPKIESRTLNKVN